MRLFAVSASQVSSRGCGCLMFGPFPFSAFRFFLACGRLPGLPPRFFFVSVRPRFPGSVTFDTRVPSGSLPSNGFTDFEEFGPRGDGLLSASMAFEICPMCGMVTFIELTVLS